MAKDLYEWPLRRHGFVSFKKKISLNVNKLSGFAHAPQML